ncbi:MAG: hypothetical protein AAB250_15365, partial [Bdellovibrionota bacterium]
EAVEGLHGEQAIEFMRDADPEIGEADVDLLGIQENRPNLSSDSEAKSIRWLISHEDPVCEKSILSSVGSSRDDLTRKDEIVAKFGTEIQAETALRIDRHPLAGIAESIE